MEADQGADESIGLEVRLEGFVESQSAFGAVLVGAGQAAIVGVEDRGVFDGRPVGGCGEGGDTAARQGESRE